MFLPLNFLPGDDNASMTIAGFTADGIAALRAALANRTINVVSPLVVSVDGLPVFTIVSGDDYYFADGRQLAFPSLVGPWPDWTGATATIEFGTVTYPAVILTPTALNRDVYFELTKVQSAALGALATETYEYGILFDLVVTLANGNRTTVVNGGILRINPSN